LLASHLTWFFPGLFLLCSRPWLLTTAARGGLEPAPASRFRGACPHQSSSYTHWALLGPLRSWRTIVSEPDHDDVTVGSLPTPHLDPQIKNVVKVDVRQERRGTAPLRRSFLHPQVFPIFHHASPQPFLNEPHDAPVCHSVLDE